MCAHKKKMIKKMNKQQLELIFTQIKHIQKLVNEDIVGAGIIQSRLDDLRNNILRELKNFVWDEYTARKAIVTVKEL
jgi:hypothetical protein